MGQTTQRLASTLKVIFYSLFPPPQQSQGQDGSKEVALPGDIARIDRFLDSRGEFRVFFPNCLSIAAPFMLFRLKRQGFSGCAVEAADRGLYLRGRR